MRQPVCREPTREEPTAALGSPSTPSNPRPMDYSSFFFYPSPADTPSDTASPDQHTFFAGPSEWTELSEQTEIPDARPPIEQPQDSTISITFSPSLRFDGLLPNSIIVSSNHVHFYVHYHRLVDASANGFAGDLLNVQPLSPGSLPSIHLPETGDVVNVLLHTMYGLSCVHFHPTLETVEAALDALVKYAITPIEIHIAPHQPLYQLVLSHASFRPIETYAMVAQRDLEELAVAVSGHLLSYDTSALTDEIVTKMGPVYLKRLVLLHQSRLAALKDILLQVPASHPATPHCDHAGQAKLTRAWAFAAAQLVWEATPSISANILRLHFEPIGKTITCDSCRLMLIQRIQDVVMSWSSVKSTI